MAKTKKGEDKPSLFRQATDYVVEYVFSLVIPVSILLYAAPGKTLDYVAGSVEEKVAFFLDVGWEDVVHALTSVLHETLPMLETEWDVIVKVLGHLPTYLRMVFDWTTLLPYEYLAVAGVLALISALIFPYKTLKGWIGKTMWRTIVLFLGVMPVDDGMALLADKEAGNYRILVVISAILCTIAANYLAWTLSWVALRLLGRGVSSVLCGLRRKPSPANKATPESPPKQKQPEAKKTEDEMEADGADFIPKANLATKKAN
eukprot:TRINITY_DN1999_c0_g1_i1.p1 TRINITY_DN1999_c0_g1~~TRINITY_DN1999_c0_g1_i1.p1  ORF type:complete len:260 (+),score=51.00 TRINITY_DN1999_c0_g1_i1:78-857(+)